MSRSTSTSPPWIFGIVGSGQPRISSGDCVALASVVIEADRLLGRESFFTLDDFRIVESLLSVAVRLLESMRFEKRDELLFGVWGDDDLKVG